MNNKKIILGIDPGLADTGFGLIEVCGSSVKCLDFGSIKTYPKEDFVERLKKIDSVLQEIIDKYKPDIASVEKLFFNTNAKTALLVGQARGVILLGLVKNKIPIFEFTPLQLKQTISNYGRADKNQIKRMIKIFLNLKELPKSDDSADALGLAICAINCLNKK
ncbi:MAG: crossover junction endodeoxyribonuclease RuvC [Patescibacteria group bacterium]|nr:crossover junction endodeoxyribonuclease RuvC [Patescibacteria group bacterium]